jgi:UDP-N-acetylmuramate--alanine ligase
VVRPAPFPSTVPDLAGCRRVHVIAAGGAAMSAIADILHTMGHRVTGSDQADSEAVQRLRAAGIDVHVGHDAALLEGVDLVVVSVAVPLGNPELDAALSSGVEVATRGDLMEALGRLRRTAAISGTHGKTTTSAMAAIVLEAGGLDPSFIVGGRVRALGTGSRWRESEWLSVEADESDGSHLRFRAEAALVTNVEPDHLDYWGDVAAMEAGFAAFLRQATTRLVCADDPGAARVAAQLRSEGLDVRGYGFHAEADYRIEGFAVTGLHSAFSVVHDGSVLCPVSLAVPGRHNAANATGVIALAHLLGIDASVAAAALEGFGGVARRFEFRGEARGVTFVDDYAHLPTEVDAAVSAAAAGGWARVVAVFEPHRYTRIRDVGADFATAFDGADVVVVTGLYAAGQAPIAGIDHTVVSDAVRRARPGLTVIDAPTRSDLVALLTSGLLRAGDLVLTMNAGDLTTLPDEVLAHPWSRG